MREWVGAEGERLVNQWCDKRRSDTFLTHHNLMFQHSKGSTHQIDQIIIHPTGIYVIEVKNMGGLLYENGETWIQLLNGKRGRPIKNKHYSPIKQNETHIRVLQESLGEISKDILVQSVIVFHDSALFEMRRWPLVHLLRFGELDDWYKSLTIQEHQLTLLQMKAINERIEELNITDPSARKLHVDLLKSKKRWRR